MIGSSGGELTLVCVKQLKEETLREVGRQADISCAESLRQRARAQHGGARTASGFVHHVWITLDTRPWTGGVYGGRGCGAASGLIPADETAL